MLADAVFPSFFSLIKGLVRGLKELRRTNSFSSLPMAQPNADGQAVFGPFALKGMPGDLLGHPATQAHRIDQVRLGQDEEELVSAESS